MRAPITDKHLLEMMWERFPEIMKRGTEPPAPVQPAEWADAHGNYQGRGVISNAAMPAPVQQEPVAKYIGECSEGSLVQLYDEVKKGTDFYTSPQPAQQKPLTDERIEEIRTEQEFDLWGISEGAFKYAARAIEAAIRARNNT